MIGFNAGRRWGNGNQSLDQFTASSLQNTQKMKIMVSRHARRRAKLYAIPESVIKQLIETTQLIDGANEIIRYVSGVKFPLKTVVLKELNMKVHYDDEIDALYLEFNERAPNGVIEIAEGVNLDTTADGKIIGIEILNASDRININTILSYTLEFDYDILKQQVA